MGKKLKNRPYVWVEPAPSTLNRRKSFYFRKSVSQSIYHGNAKARFRCLETVYFSLWRRISIRSWSFVSKSWYLISSICEKCPDHSAVDKILNLRKKILTRCCIHPGIVYNSHVLIAINRVWAVLAPHSYRERHQTPHMAIGLCVAMYAIVHSICLPLWLQDWLYYRAPIRPDAARMKQQCLMNTSAQPTLLVVCKIIYNGPNVVMVVATLIILWAKHRQQRRRRLAINQANALMVPAGRDR